MYGLVNRAIEQLVVSKLGEAGWERVCARARVDNEGFVAMCPYHDDITYRLVGAVSQEMGLSVNEVLQAFGEYWVLYTADEGYGELMNVAGTDLRAFLGNLNAMHGRVEGVFKNMSLPHFRVEDVGDDEYLLHYESRRAGLAPMVVGIVRGLARRFGQDIHIEHVRSRDGAGGADAFRIREVAPALAS